MLILDGWTTAAAARGIPGSLKGGSSLPTHHHVRPCVCHLVVPSFGPWGGSVPQPDGHSSHGGASVHPRGPQRQGGGEARCPRDLCVAFESMTHLTPCGRVNHVGVGDRVSGMCVAPPHTPPATFFPSPRALTIFLTVSLVSRAARLRARWTRCGVFPHA